jgi:electron transport complex protein RnfC
VITDIGNYPTAHASGIPAPCIVLTPDGKNEMLDFQAREHPTSVQSLKAVMLHAGIIGMGGAGFPSFRKLSNKGGQIHTLLVNGAECEPFITCDDLLMRERADEVIGGAMMTAIALGAVRVLIGVEDNKPTAIAALHSAYSEQQNRATQANVNVEIHAVPTLYPMGGSDQLITQLTQQEIPANGHSTDLGLMMFNVATMAAVYKAVTRGKPVLTRIVTVTGFAIDRPCNLEVPIGTPFAHLVNHAGLKTPVEQWIMGGPMMGIPLPDHQVPVIKTSNCILVNPPEPTTETMPCIRCGACMDVCPINLLPQQMYWYAKTNQLPQLEAHNIKDCIECGCCAFVCPSHIPLVQYYRHGKVAIRADQAEKTAQIRAKQRHTAQLARKAEEERERAERIAAKKAAMMSAENASPASTENPTP